MNNNIGSMVNQTTSFNKWFCIQNICAKNVQAKYKDKASLSQKN